MHLRIRNICHLPSPLPTVAARRDAVFFTGFAVCLRSIGRPTLTNFTTTPCRMGEGQLLRNGVPPGPVGRRALRQETLQTCKTCRPPHTTHTYVRENDVETSVSAALFPGISVAALPATSGGLRRIARPKGHPVAGSTDCIRSHPQPAVELCLWP